MCSLWTSLEGKTKAGKEYSECQKVTEDGTVWLGS